MERRGRRKWERKGELREEDWSQPLCVAKVTPLSSRRVAEEIEVERNVGRIQQIDLFFVMKPNQEALEGRKLVISFSTYVCMCV